MIKPKLVQIAPQTYVNADGDTYTQMFAVDEDGGVWEYSFMNEIWKRLSEKRRD